MLPVLRAFAVVAVVAVVAEVADVALVAEVAVAALPLMLMPHVPVAPDPLVEGASRLRRAPDAVAAPVPPLATASVPPSVRVPELVIGEPVKDRPVEPPDAATDVTLPPPEVAAMEMPPALFVMVMPEPAVSVAFVSVLPVLLPMSNCPSVYEV